MIWFASWLITIEVIGLGALPLAARLFRFLPDRGIIFSKALGILLVGYAAWALGLSGMLRFERATLLMLALLLFATMWIAWGRIALKELRAAGRPALIAEGTFLLVLGAASLIRAYNPEIAGTEKPMDMAFLNAIQRSQQFPPEDPWMAGYGISYYYFGYLLLAVVGKLAAVPASVGYNLGVALVFALLLAGSYSIVFNLLTVIASTWSESRRVLGALMGPLMLGIIGNLEIAFEVLAARGVGDQGFWTAVGIDGLQASAEPAGWFPATHWWWWRASRVIPTIQPDGINEFPLFSFLLGDLHPHYVVLPWALLAVTLALATFLRRDVQLRSADRWIWVLVPALALGFLLVGNSWDFPTYTALFWLASVSSTLAANGGWTGGTRPVLGTLRGLLVVTVVSVLIYLPFMIGLGSQVKGIGVSTDRTPLISMLIIFGPYLYVLAVFLIWMGRPSRPSFGHAGFAVWAAGALLVAASWWLGSVALIAGLLALALYGFVLAFIPRGASRGLGPSSDDARVALPGASKGTPRASLAPLMILIGLGLVLILAPEFLFLVDSFGTRMNTVFKLHYQAWVILALPAAVALVWMIGVLEPLAARVLVAVGAALLISVALLYPAAAIPSKTQGFQRSPTLDGSAYLASVHAGEYEAIRWLAENANSDSVVLEASGGQYSAYARVSTFSGVPTVLGWAGHEVQWRGSGNEIQRRLGDIDAIYRSAGDAAVASLLAKYRIRYIFVGRLELEKYGPGLGEAFDRSGGLVHPVFRQGEITIYEVAGSMPLVAGVGT